MKFSFNMGGLDSAIRLILGVILIALGYFGIITGTGAIVAYVIAAIAILTALIKFCPLYAVLGIKTCKSN